MKKTAKIILITMILLVFTASAAFAVNTSVELKAGPFGVNSISISPFNGGAPVILSGDDQQVEAAIGDFDIIDARGNNKGWILRISATPFTNGSGGVLHEGALSITGATVSSRGNSDPFDGNCSILNGIRLTEIPQGFIIVPESRGKGTYTVSGARLALDIWPSEALVGTYTSTITFGLETNVK